MSVVNSADRAMGNANFIAAAKMIEFNNIQPSLVEYVVKQELDRNSLKYDYPAKIGNAQIHRDAYKFGYNPSRRGQSPRVCPCCLERVQTEELGICYRTSKVQVEEEMGYSEYKLRPGISLFFSFIKMLTFYFIFRFLVCDGFNAITNLVAGHYCEDVLQVECEAYIWNLASLFNKKKNATFILIQDILSLVLVILSIGFFFLYRKRQYNKAKILNNRNQVQQDYTILVQNIPLIDFPTKNQAKKMRANQTQNMELYHRQHLWKYFESKVRGWIDHRESWRQTPGSNQADFRSLVNKNNGQLRSQDIVKSVSLCYNLQRLETLQKQRNELVKNSKKYQKLRKQLQQQADDASLGIQEVESDNRFSSVPKQVQFLNDCEVILNKQYASDNSVLFNVTNFVGKALVSFQYQHYREYILSQADRSLNFLVFNGTRLKVSRVSNPRDINWLNLRHPQQKHKKKSFTTIYVMALIVGVCFGLLCAIQFGRRQAERAFDNGQKNILGVVGGYGFVGLQILIIVVINQILIMVAKKRVKQECHYTKTAESLSVILKSVLSQFICTAILPYIVSRIFGSALAGRTGLVFQMTAIIIVYGILINIMSIIFPKAIFRACRNGIKYRGRAPEDTVNKFQIELNRQFQYIEFDIINRYVNYLVLVYASFFYAYLIPITIPFLAIIFFLQFWIDKINLFKRSSHPRNFSFFLTRIILKAFEASIFIFALGVFVFGIYIHNSPINILNLVTLGISIIYLWFLIGASIKLERRLFGSYQSSQNQMYDDCVAQGKFEETYWTQNPATYLVKESEVTGRQHMLNPGLNKIFVSYDRHQ